MKKWCFEQIHVQAVQAQLNRNTRSRLDRRGGCLLFRANVKRCRSCNDELIMWLASSLFKLLKRSKACLPTFGLTLGHCWCTFWPHNERLERKLHLLCCFSSTVMIPGIRHILLLGNRTEKEGLWSTYLPFFSAWDKHACWHAMNGVLLSLSVWRTTPQPQTHKANLWTGLQQPACQFHFYQNRICAGFLCTQTDILLYPAKRFCCSLLCFLRALSGINETMAAQSLLAIGPHNRHWEEGVFLFGCERHTDRLISSMTRLHITL